MISAIIELDIFISQFINQLIPHTQFFNDLFSFFSLRGISFFIWIFVIISIIIIEEIFHPGIQKRDIKFIVIFLISFSITYISSDVILKNIFKRTRPVQASYQTSQSNGVQCPKDFSFPSTHAATAFSSAVVLTFFDKKRKWFYYLLATIIALSRIYLSCHYFLDVFIGALLGFIISKYLFPIIFKKIDFLPKKNHF